MTATFDRRSALKRLGAAGVGLSLPGWLGGCATNASRPSSQRPNIVFIMTDDHAQGAMGIYGNTTLKTPNLDRIGTEGLRFDQAFVTNSLCLPSRATFLTGQYSHTHGMLTNGEESGFTDEPALRNAATWPIQSGNAGNRRDVIGAAPCPPALPAHCPAAGRVIRLPRSAARHQRVPPRSPRRPRPAPGSPAAGRGNGR